MLRVVGATFAAAVLAAFGACHALISFDPPDSAGDTGDAIDGGSDAGGEDAITEVDPDASDDSTGDDIQAEADAQGDSSFDTDWEALPVCPECALGATRIEPEGGRYTGRLGATESRTSGSCGGAGQEVVFAFTIDEAKDVFFSTHGSAFDTVLYVRACDCQTGDEIECNDDASGTPQSSIRYGGLPAGTYYLFLDAKNMSAGSAYTFDAYITDPGAPGDRCGNPEPLTTDGAKGNTCGFNMDYSPMINANGSCNSQWVGGAEDVVYYVVLAAPTMVRFQTCASSGYCPDDECLDTSVYVRGICTDSGSERVCSEDACGFYYSFTNIHSDTGQLTIPAGIHYVFVDGYYDGPDTVYHCGNYDLTYTQY